MTRAFEVDRDGFVYLPTRVDELEGSFLYHSARVRSWPVPGDDGARFVQLLGGEVDGPDDYADAVTLRVDAVGLARLIDRLDDVLQSILTGEMP